MTATVKTTTIQEATRATRTPLIIPVPGSTIAWDLPAGGLWIGLPLAVAAIVLGIRARRELAGEAGSRMAIVAIVLGALAIGQMVVFVALT